MKRVIPALFGNVREPSTVESMIGIEAVSPSTSVHPATLYFFPAERIASKESLEALKALQYALNMSESIGTIIVFDQTGAVDLCSLLDEDEELDCDFEECMIFHFQIKSLSRMSLLSSKYERMRRAGVIEEYENYPGHVFGREGEVISRLVLDPSVRVVEFLAEATSNTEILDYLSRHSSADVCMRAQDKLNNEWEYLDHEFKPIEQTLSVLDYFL